MTFMGLGPLSGPSSQFTFTAPGPIDVINVYKRLLCLEKNYVYKRFLFLQRLLKIINVDQENSKSVMTKT